MPCKRLGLGAEPPINGKDPTIGSLGGPGGKFFGFRMLKYNNTKKQTVNIKSNILMIMVEHFLLIQFERVGGEGTRLERGEDWLDKPVKTLIIYFNFVRVGCRYSWRQRFTLSNFFSAKQILKIIAFILYNANAHFYKSFH